MITRPHTVKAIGADAGREGNGTIRAEQQGLYHIGVYRYDDHEAEPPALPGGNALMSDGLNFSLSRESLYEQVANALEKMIIGESLLPGDKLPAEREIAERLGVSRTVVREATRVLNVRGLVKIKQGSGTFVQRLSPRDAVAPISRLLKQGHSGNSLKNLCEVRRTLEIGMAGLAAERADEKDIVEMETIIEDMFKHVEDAERFVKCDLAFHSAIAAATHNELYDVLLIPITDLLLEFRLTDYRFDARSAIEGGLTHHHRILDHIRARDVSGARQAMSDHLDQAESVFSASRASTP
jgi:GntR family transcriptional repressor for pyruvate dehydrogenase complex